MARELLGSGRTKEETMKKAHRRLRSLDREQLEPISGGLNLPFGIVITTQAQLTSQLNSTANKSFLKGFSDGTKAAALRTSYK
jgi:hypothetical protein